MNDSILKCKNAKQAAGGAIDSTQVPHCPHTHTPVSGVSVDGTDRSS